MLLTSCPGNAVLHTLLDGDGRTATLGPAESQGPLSSHGQKTQEHEQRSVTQQAAAQGLPRLDISFGLLCSIPTNEPLLREFV